MVALLAIVGYAGRREIAQQSAGSIVITKLETSEPPPLSPEEEAYATALWPMHSEIVEPSAVRLSFAGLVYATENHDARKLAATLQPLSATFHTLLARARELDVPASMQTVHEQYLEALTLYEKASREMLKVAADGNEHHLIVAQAMSGRASEELLKAGDVLWPGEHKPN